MCTYACDAGGDFKHLGSPTSHGISCVQLRKNGPAPYQNPHNTGSMNPKTVIGNKILNNNCAADHSAIFQM